MDTENRIAIVTGSDSGIGRATAAAFARAGYDAGITWHEDKDGAEETAAEVRQLGSEGGSRSERWTSPGPKTRPV